jgi:DNA-binding MarR family transcriptional regulator
MRPKNLMNRVSLTGTGLCVCFQLRRTSRAITQLYDAALQPSGIRSTQFALLVAIAKKEPIRISELSEIVVIDTTTLSRSLRKLERMGHLKIVSGSDRRERLVRMTAKGQAVLGESVSCWRKIQEKVVSRLMDPDWLGIQAQLEKIKQISQQVSPASE